MQSYYPSRKRELIFGLIYLPVHIFATPFFVAWLAFQISSVTSLKYTNANVTLLYYLVSFIVLLVFMRGYLLDSFSVFLDRNIQALSSALLGYVQYIALLYVMIAIVTLIKYKTGTNPNSAAISDQIAQNSRAMLLASTLLAPIVEETLFRGALFGLISRKSRVAAYIVSFLFFSSYHLWSFAAKGLDPMFLYYMFQYLPGSLVLARCYERSGTIWSPIILHMMINGVSVLASR